MSRPPELSEVWQGEQLAERISYTRVNVVAEGPASSGALASWAPVPLSAGVCPASSGACCAASPWPPEPPASRSPGSPAASLSPPPPLSRGACPPSGGGAKDPASCSAGSSVSPHAHRVRHRASVVAVVEIFI